MRLAESLLWYEAEWTASVASPAGYLEDQHDESSLRLHDLGKPYGESNVNPRNCCGTFRWIERMAAEPARW